MLLTTLFSKNFQKRILVERIFENERSLEVVLLNYCNLVFCKTPKGFNSMQFKSSTRKKLSQPAVSKFDLANVLLNV